jgi:GGDEF domain-containing protein
LQTEVRESTFTFKNHKITISASIGIGHFDPTPDTSLHSFTPKEIIDYLIQKADLHMYQGKDSNSNSRYSPNYELSAT